MKCGPQRGLLKAADMLRNYFKIAWRNLTKYKVVSLINILGLAIGLTCCLLILAYILNELSYDRYNQHAGQVYRVSRTFYNGNGDATLTLCTVAPPFGYYFPHDFPEIQKMTRLLNTGTVPLRYGEKRLDEQQVYFADQNLFDVFTVHVTRGNPKTALSGPFSAMLTEETARKFFGDENPVGKILRASNQFDVRVTGVYRAFPANAHIHPQMLVSFSTLRDSAIYGEKNLRTNWGNNMFLTYLLLPKGYDIRRMEARFPAFLDQHMQGEYGPNRPSKYTRLSLQKLTDIHLYSHTDDEVEPGGDITRVYLFAAIALFILLIACINYMNLATARSALRAKEIGIRKVAGAGRKELVLQFLSESVLLTWIAMAIAFGLLYLTLPWLNRVTGQSLSVRILAHWQIWIPIALSPFAVGLLSGLYPAAFLSSVQPAKASKGLLPPGGSVRFRKALVVFQFAVSIVLMITTAVVFQQLRYMQNAALGYDKDHIVTLPYYPQLKDHYESFRQALLQDPGIKNVTRSSRIPTGRLLDEMGAQAPGSDSLVPVKADIRCVAVDENFVPAYGIQLAAGRNFSRSFGTDTSGFILNEAAVRAIGWKSPQDAVGSAFQYGGISGRIIGVVRDFHFESLRQTISPLILFMPSALTTSYSYNHLSVDLSGKNTPSALATIRKTWQRYLPDMAYRYSYLDDDYARLYKAEARQETLFRTFSCLAILIACLGLLGLSAFAISQRTKEIGVRKVLGASVSHIVMLLSGDFIRLVVFAFLIAAPVGYWWMHRWLGGFPYRIDMEWWVFVLAGILSAAVALVTVSWQAIRAATTNPVHSLRSE